jgi:hypothetical protein
MKGPISSSDQMSQGSESVDHIRFAKVEPALNAAISVQVPELVDFLDTCKEYFKKIPIRNINNQILDQFECTVHEITVKWIADSSTPWNQLHDRETTETIDLRNIFTLKDIPKKKEGIAINVLRERLARIDVPIIFNEKNTHTEFSIQTELVPWDLPLKIVGVYLLRMQLKNDVWQLDGVLI